jgi:hypothetical protein
MSNGEMFYVVMAAGSASAFALVLAYYSHQQTKADRKIAKIKVEAPAVPRAADAHAARG